MGFFDIFRSKKAPEKSRGSRTIRHSFGRSLESAFSGADSGRLNASWGGTPMTADMIIRRHQKVLVARSRQQATENDYARAFLRLCRQNIVGSHGVQFQSKVADKLAAQAIEDAWAKWSRKRNCDVTGKKSFRSFELACVQAAAKDGEFMIRYIYGKDAGEYGFSLQWLDPQKCPVDYDIQNWGNTGNFIRHGIEFTDLGKPVAYHFMTTNELEVEYSTGGRNYVRIPASEIVHGFRDELGGQKRGLPWMATGLFKLRHVGGMEDAAIVNARVGAAKMGFLQWKEGMSPQWAREAANEDEDFTVESEAGTFPILPDGMEMKEWSPQYPSGEFSDFTKHMLRSISSGWGVLYNNLASDLEGVNFSSIRQGTLDERERWKDDQEWLIDDLHQEVFERWLEYSLLGRKIKGAGGQPLRAEKIETYLDCEWQPRRWTWIDPSADVKAAVESKNNLLKSPGELIREGGREPSVVFAEIAADISEMKAAGIPEEIIKSAFSDKLVPPPAPQKENSNAKA